MKKTGLTRSHKYALDARMKDVQSQPDDRQIPIHKVGIKEIRYPITLLDQKDKVQHTVASINMYVDLPQHFKGTHMSRFVEILGEHHKAIHIDELSRILQCMRATFEAECAHLEISFPYFIEKKAPVTQKAGLMEYQCYFLASANEACENIIMGVEVPLMTLCPCSKEISDFGAHNQRGVVKLKIRTSEMIWLEELITQVELCGSAPVYSVLKRPDEKFVTEQSYQNPKFVEDVVREVAEKMNHDPRIQWYQVSAENFESIHNHNAYAFIENTK